MEDPGEGVGLDLLQPGVARQVDHSQVQVVVESRNFNLAAGHRLSAGTGESQPANT